MRYRRSFLFFLGAFLLQSTVLCHFSLWGVGSNLLLCVLTISAFFYEDRAAISYGVLFGLLQDVCFSQILGLSALAYLCTALLLRYLRVYWVKDSLLSLLFLSAAGTLSYDLLRWLLDALFLSYYSFLPLLVRIPLQILFHTVILWIGYQLVAKRSLRHPEDRYLRGI